MWGALGMSAGNADRPRGRTTDELERAAARVHVRDAIHEYRSLRSLPEEFSYSLETREIYDANNFEDRMALLENYSDEHLEVYMIAITDIQGTINDEYAELVAESCIQQGQIPFIGRWTDRGIIHEDVSVAIDHGVPSNTIKHMLLMYKQKSCLVVRPTMRVFVRTGGL